MKMTLALLMTIMTALSAHAKAACTDVAQFDKWTKDLKSLEVINHGDVNDAATLEASDKVLQALGNNLGEDLAKLCLTDSTALPLARVLTIAAKYDTPAFLAQEHSRALRGAYRATDSRLKKGFEELVDRKELKANVLQERLKFLGLP